MQVNLKYVNTVALTLLSLLGFGMGHQLLPHPWFKLKADRLFG